MQNSTIPEADYKEFSRYIHEEIAINRTPVKGTIELTARCNLKCKHCYMPPAENANELNYKEVCEIFDDIKKNGCFWLLLTGGEPLLRDDFLDVYLYAKRQGFIITIFSNGTLITSNIAKCLRYYRPFEVEVSLYGITKKTYEEITCVPGSFKRCLEGIKLLKKYNIPFSLKTVATRQNKHEIGKIKRYAESLNVDFRFDPILNPRLDGSKEPCKFRLSIEEIVKLDRLDWRRIKELRDIIKKIKKRPMIENIYSCGAGKNSFCIDAYANLYPCILSRYLPYNLRKGNFKEGFYDFLPKIYNTKITRVTKCTTCNQQNLCRQCPGRSYLENGDPEGPLEFLCKLSLLRIKSFGLN